MNTSTAGFRCALVGADTLLIECGRMLLDHGHDIVSVAAGSARVKEWAANAGIAVHDIDAIDAWADVLTERSVDHVFAITHLQLLPTSVVSAPRGLCINFHDGPLPEYAGLNTPVWGILRGETQWGVTWHCIDNGVDTGDVLLQRRFDIADRETSLSLNTRNFEEALDSFSELLDRIETDRLHPTAQDPRVPRGVFGRANRPDGVLNFETSAGDVDRVVRALHFGSHHNPVAAAVLWHPAGAVTVGASEPTANAIGGAPSTVLAIDSLSITVACSTGAVILRELRRLDGTACSVREFVELTGIELGAQMPRLSVDQRQWLTRFAVSSQRHEAEMVTALSELSAADLPWPHEPARATREYAAVPISIASGSLTPSQVIEALGALLARWNLSDGLDVALAHEPVPEFARPLVCTHTVLDLSDRSPQSASGWLRDLVGRTPHLAGRNELANGLALPIGVRRAREHSQPDALVIVQPAEESGWEVAYDTGAVSADDAAAFARCIAAIATGSTLVPQETVEQVVHRWNTTDVAVEPACIHELIERQAAEMPQAEAVVCGADSLSYEQLLSRSRQLAARLQQVGVGPDSLVGVYVDRSVDLVVAVLGILEAGGAYVPLDPTYPAERLRHMIADSDARIVVCQQRYVDRLPMPVDDLDRTVIAVDASAGEATPIFQSVEPHNLAYCIYTSGSTGAPKGVLVEHRNVVNLFTAMDAVVPHGQHDTWFAVTSLSFDISVLELLYTLARGIRVVIHAPEKTSMTARRAMDFSLFYFAADEAAGTTESSGGKYRLLLDGARFADANGFCAVWTPERHFHSFGGLYPNPAVTSAAVAAVTERVAVRGGSVVLPLHHPVEVAEAWSMVDNLSNGRVGIAFASGWQPDDFVLRPENYSHAKETMFEGIDQVQRLWRGETVAFDGPDQALVGVATLPRPVQPELPMWITTAGDRKSFAAAGTMGANVLTHLVGQSIEQLEPKIAEYHAARAAAGHDPTTGTVTLMLHAFIGDDDAQVRATVRKPLRSYLGSSFSLLREHAWAFPTFRRPDGQPVTGPRDLADDDIAQLAGDDLDAVLDFAAERYYDTSGLFGTPDRVLPLIERLHQIGVDEIACLVDFGIDTEVVLAHLPHLAKVRELAASARGSKPAEKSESIAESVMAARTTHLQCTPSMARMFTLDPAMRIALGAIDHLLVGGENLPGDLADELCSLTGGTVTNMYGPTETTVWSSAARVVAGADWVAIGSPIANTYMYVLDATGQPTPPGVAGDLWIGGKGVARGYHRQAELTAAKFQADPFRPDGRMYRTGDLARWREGPDGAAALEFLGRRDQQVKLRGHRIELGEIETELRRTPGVTDAAVVIHDVGDDQQLVAFIVSEDVAAAADAKVIRDDLRTRLPEAMVPGYVVTLPSLPRTPNGKLDRRALPTPTYAALADPSPATTDVEHLILREWRNVLGRDDIGIDDNFFDVGGHSLLIVRLHRRLRQSLERDVALTDLYRFPTVRGFANSLGSDVRVSHAIDTARDRAARRRAATRGAS